VSVPSHVDWAARSDDMVADDDQTDCRRKTVSDDDIRRQYCTNVDEFSIHINASITMTYLPTPKP